MTSFNARHSNHYIMRGQVFWLPDRSTCRAFPSIIRTVAMPRRSSTVTAAGPQRIYTVFPIKLHSARLTLSEENAEYPFNSYQHNFC
jgi:hypothetical protein